MFEVDFNHTDRHIRSDSDSFILLSATRSVEIVQEIGKWTSTIAEDSPETAYLLQRISIAIWLGSAVLFMKIFTGVYRRDQTHLMYI